MRARYFLFRIVHTIVLLFFVLTALFFFFRFLPGDFTNLMTFRGASPEAVAAFEEKWGLNDPLHVQYIRYVTNFVQGDVGHSLEYREPVWEYVKIKIFNSFILVGPAITFSYLIGSLLGAFMGSKRGGKIEEYGLVPFIFAGSLPSFFTSILLIIIFSSWLGIFPSSGLMSAEALIGSQGGHWLRPYFSADFLMHYILPFTAVVGRYLFLPLLIMRTSVTEVLSEPYFHYHKLTGLPKARQYKHLLRSASLPVITLYPVSMTRSIGGLVLIESVFNWPGIGYALINAVLFRDLPVVMFVFFLMAAFIIISNLVVDIVYSFIDPRVTVGE